MQQLVGTFAALDARRRVIVILSALAMFAAVIGIARLASTPSMSLLYSGLEPAASGDVIRALDQSGVAYEIRGNAIYVEAGRRDQMRMQLAGDGIPANSAQGYELLDNLTGFGTTSQMFDAAYWRAKEGELARTIVASPHISAARVHIANTSSRPFSRDMVPSASVTVTTAQGTLSRDHAEALRYLVASAVAGLEIDNVAVIDGRGGLIAGQDEPGTVAGAQGVDRAAEMKRNLERLLAARVGTGRAIVEVSVENVTEREVITERRFDPDNRVAISTDTEERSSQSSDSGSGDITVASNLPDGDAAGGASNSSSQDSETREQINYEVAETQRELLRTPGAIKRVSVAVLVDGIRNVAADGTETWEPRGDSELASLEALVASAVGFNADRGDVITIRSLEFQPLPEAGTEAQATTLAFLDGFDVMSTVQLAVLSVVALILGLFVVRPVLMSGASAPVGGATGLALPPVAPMDDQPLVGADTPAFDAAEPLTDTSLPVLPEPAIADFGPPDLPGLAPFPGAGEDPAERLRAMIEERQSETLEVLQSWVEGEQKAS